MHTFITRNLFTSMHFHPTTGLSGREREWCCTLLDTLLRTGLNELKGCEFKLWFKLLPCLQFSVGSLESSHSHEMIQNWGHLCYRCTIIYIKDPMAVIKDWPGKPCALQKYCVWLLLREMDTNHINVLCMLITGSNIAWNCDDHDCESRFIQSITTNYLSSNLLQQTTFHPTYYNKLPK